MKTRKETYDIVVCGGGMAGLCAALAAARGGAKTCLVQDRPVLGGNSSSEIRVTVHGSACHHHYAREVGILSEMLIEERQRNHEEINENGWTNSVWDMVQYDFVQREPNLTVHLNTTVTDLVMDDGQRASQRLPDRPPAHSKGGYIERPSCPETGRIRAVLARIANAETELTLEATEFLDCTGDALVADFAGCGWRIGTESAAETGEPHAPAEASTDVMGNSIHIRARDMGRPCPFTPPDWAVHHEDPDYFYEQGRKPADPRGGFWWIEIGVPWDTIHDQEVIRHELTRHALGIWDWMKNHDPVMKERCRNYALDWIGQVPGKRESRRVFGQTWLNEHDLQACRKFPDEIAFGGWFVDLHTPGGLLADHSEPASAEGYKPDSEYAAMSHVGPYGIPLGILISRDIDNLSMAGRNVSVTHAALGSVRVMATCALMGQALGTAAAVAIRHGISIEEVRRQHIQTVQQQLLLDGCWLPNVRNQDEADLAPEATASASSERTLLGAGPADQWAHGGLGWNPPEGHAQPLSGRVAQFIASDGGPLQEIQLFLDAQSDAPTEVPLVLRAVDHLWQYTIETGTVLAQTNLSVPKGGGWVTWEVRLPQCPAGWLRLEAGPAKGLAWRCSPAFLPGHVSLFQMSPTRMRRVLNGATLCYRLDRPQAACQAKAALSGTTRPVAGVERWISDPAQPLPQWLQLEWPGEVSLKEVHLTFPGYLLREYHSTPPGFLDPQMPRQYRLQFQKSDGSWQTLVQVEYNTTRHRRHAFPTITTQRLRLIVEATHGDPAASLAEIRAYA